MTAINSIRVVYYLPVLYRVIEYFFCCDTHYAKIGRSRFFSLELGFIAH